MCRTGIQGCMPRACAQQAAQLNGKSPAFCADRGELHATNAGTGMCRLDRSEARCRSVAGGSAESFVGSLKGWVIRRKAPHPSLLLGAALRVPFGVPFGRSSPLHGVVTALRKKNAIHVS